MIYFARIGNVVKIGRTTNLRARMRDHQKSYGNVPVVLGVTEGSKQEEQAAHRRFAHLRLNRDRHRHGVELFEATPELLRYIERYCRKPDMLDEFPENGRANHIRLELDDEQHAEMRVIAAQAGMSMAAWARLVVVKAIEQAKGASRPKGKGRA